MKKRISASSRSPYGDIRQELKAICSTTHKTRKQKEGFLRELGKILCELDQARLDIEPQQNSLSVERASIIGEICLFLKDISLPQHWTKWAAKNLKEDIGTLHKYMAIAQSRAALQYNYLGTEKVYQLTRIEHLLGEGKVFKDLFKDCGLDTKFTNYSCRELQVAANVILNKELLNREWDIDVPDDLGRALSENFGLIEDNHGLLTRLVEAKDEEANMAKVITNLITNGRREGSPGGKKPRPQKLNPNRAIEVLVQRLHEPVDRPGGKREDIDERLRFLKKLLDEYFRHKAAGNP